MFTHLPQKERIAYVALFLGFLLIAGYVGARQIHRPPPIVLQQLSSGSGSSKGMGVDANAPNESPVIHVAGAVAKPGVYKLSPGARVIDAVTAAGGLAKDADPEQLNLAAKLMDGTQVFVPRKSGLPGASALVPSIYSGGNASSSLYSITPPSSSGGKSKGKSPSAPVNLNRATADQLQSIPGIGPATAQRILDYRQEHGQFHSVDELTAVGGIGAKKLAAMRKWLRI